MNYIDELIVLLNMNRNKYIYDYNTIIDIINDHIYRDYNIRDIGQFTISIIDDNTSYKLVQDIYRLLSINRSFAFLLKSLYKQITNYVAYDRFIITKLTIVYLYDLQYYDYNKIKLRGNNENSKITSRKL